MSRRMEGFEGEPLSTTSHTRALRTYRFVLRVYPAAFRAEYGAAMEEMFLQRWAEAHSSGRGHVLRVWLRETVGLLRSASGERIRSAVRARKAGGSGRRGGGWGRETGHASRRLLRTPAFTLATVLTLGLALGANAAIFTLVHRVVLRPLPYADPDRLVHLEHAAPGWGYHGDIGLSEAMYVTYGRHARQLAQLAVHQSLGQPLSADGDAERVRVTRTTSTLASLLGVQPREGRWFVAGEMEPQSPCVVVLSHGFRVRRYGSGDAVGRRVDLNGRSCDVIGVMPAGFAFPDANTLLWTPVQFDTANARVGGLDYMGVARLSAGADLALLRTELNGLIARLPQDYPGDATARELVSSVRMASLATSLQDEVVGTVADALWILLVSVSIVLLVACGNVANLFMVRSEARQREMAIRRALGAGRREIARFAFAESMLLSAAGGALALLLAWTGVRLLVRFGPQDMPRLAEVQVDGVVFAFTVGLAVLAAIVFGTLPLVRAGQDALTLMDAGRGGTAGRSRMRTRQLLVGGQVALALVLLVAAGLMLRSFQNLRQRDPGFVAESALTFRLGLPEHDYPVRDRERAAAVHTRVLERLSVIAGVNAVSAATCRPLEGYCYGDPITVAGVERRPGEIPPAVAMRRVASGWFETAGLRRVSGRLLDATDANGATFAVVVSEELTRRYFPAADPIGQRLFVHLDAVDPQWYTVVGVVADAATFSLLESQPTPTLYLPLLDQAVGPILTSMTYILRTAVPPLSVVEAVRRAVAEAAPGVPVTQPRTLDDVVAAAGGSLRFLMTLLLVAATVALLLGVIGIYAVISYAVSRRTREIGIRMAMGARPRDVAVMILRSGARVTAAGIAVGLLTALFAGNGIRAVLFGVGVYDVVTWVAVTILLVLVAFFACALPARRAARLHPLVALRIE